MGFLLHNHDLLSPSRHGGDSVALGFHGNQDKECIVVTNLLLIVDICLRSHQMFYYWKMPMLTGDKQWCPTILEVR